jgi:putative acetyltransferase
MSAIGIRLATPADAHQALNAICRSITELCEADHQCDAPTLERWLRNKTPEHFDNWCADPDSRLIVGELNAVIAGVAALHRSGEIRLFYVRPDCVRSGVGRALLLALEAHARVWKIAVLKLNSSLTARHFYERCGFLPAGDSTSHFGVLRGYPYTKTLSLSLSPR